MPHSRFAELLESARAAQKNAYSPYSDYKIGCAVLLESGEIASGANVENASYGATICAERSAILAAVSSYGAQRVLVVVVVSSSSPPWPPCGMCRQVLAEFCDNNCLIYAVNDNDERLEWRFGELFPSGFSGENLQ